MPRSRFRQPLAAPIWRVAGVGERFTLGAVAQYADASNFIPSMVDTAATVERKYALFPEHCGAVTAAGLTAKRELVPRFRRAMERQTAGGLRGTPERAVERLLTLVRARCEYLMLSVRISRRSVWSRGAGGACRGRDFQVSCNASPLRGHHRHSSER